MKKYLTIIILSLSSLSMADTYQVVINKSNYTVSDNIIDDGDKEYNTLLDEFLAVSTNAQYIYGSSIEETVFKPDSYMQVRYTNTLNISIKLKEEKIVKGIRLYHDDAFMPYRKKATIFSAYSQSTHSGNLIPSSGWNLHETINIPVLESLKYKDFMFSTPMEKTNAFHFSFYGSSENGYQGLQYIQFLY